MANNGGNFVAGERCDRCADRCCVDRHCRGCAWEYPLVRMEVVVLREFRELAHCFLFAFFVWLFVICDLLALYSPALGAAVNAVRFTPNHKVTPPVGGVAVACGRDPRAARLSAR